MNGRFLQRLISLPVFCLALVLIFPVTTKAEQRIGVLLSDREDAYLEMLLHFRAGIDVPSDAYNLEGNIENAPKAMEELLARHPSLILALGAKAAYIAKTWTQNTTALPVLFAGVINPEKYGLDHGDNMSGIATLTSPATQLANLLLFAPGVKRLGLIHGTDFPPALLTEMRSAAALLNITLVEDTISDPLDFKRSYKKMRDTIDSFFVPADLSLYSLENITWLQQRCIQDRIVCIGQSRNIVSKGLLLAVDPDRPSIGRQAAAMAQNILRKHGKATSGIMPPLGTRVIINLDTAQAISLKVSELALDMANEVIGK